MAGLLLVAALAPAGAGAQEATRHAVIEVGSSGIKPLVAEWVQEEDDDGTLTTVRSFQPRNVTPADPAALPETVKVVAEVAQEIAKSDGVPLENIHIVGSSGLAGVAHSSAMAADISQAAGRPMKFIDAQEEMRYTFRDVVPAGTLNHVTCIDIGSGNSKAAYYFEQDGRPRLRSGQITTGTKTLAKDLMAAGGGDAEYRKALEAYAKDHIAPQLRASARHAKYVTQPRVYLSGGIAWAMTSALRPDTAATAKHHFVLLEKAEIKAWLEKAIADPRAAYEFKRLPEMTAEDVAAAEDRMAEVREAFTPQQIQAGATILLAIYNEWDFEGREKILFTRKALYAWPRGYLKAQLQQAVARPRGPIPDEENITD